MEGKEIVWDEPQGIDARKGKIYGHAIKEDALTDFHRK